MPRSNSQSKALFYPNLCCSIQVRVALDGLNSQNRNHFDETKDITIYASNDMGTASSETRHFIDLNFLLTLLGNQKQLVRSMLTAPTRPCSRLVGVGGGDNKSCRVLGMLAEPLNVRLCNVESPTQTIWTPIILPTNVLVYVYQFLCTFLSKHFKCIPASSRRRFNKFWSPLLSTNNIRIGARTIT